MRRLRKALTTAVLTALLVGSTAGWASESGESALNGPLPGTAAWLADDSLDKELPDPTTATPSEVAVFFADLTDTQQRRLVEDHPTVVGNLDGVPVNLRYEANAPAGDQVLAYDPRGRGLIARVAGDLENATHVSVIVPGSDVDISTSDRTARWAADLRAEADLQEEAGDGTAVIAWAGYTTPPGIGLDLATGRLAEVGAERLTRFTDGLDAVGLPDPSLFCHSYGSVVCGLAAPEVDASDIVVMGSPGMRADDVTALDTDAHIWAAKSPDDWIDRVPNVEVLGLGHGADPTSPGFGATVLPADDVTALDTDAHIWAAKSPDDWIDRVPNVEVLGLGHGADPTSPGFGATVLPADDVPAHDKYFTPGTSTLTAFAAIAGGGL